MGRLGPSAVLATVAAVAVACGNGEPTATTVAPTAFPLSQATPTVRLEPTATMVPTPVPTATSPPVGTPAESPTPVPEATAIPTPTPTPVRASIRPIGTPAPQSNVTTDPGSTPSAVITQKERTPTPRPAPTPTATAVPTPTPTATPASEETPTPGATPAPDETPSPGTTPDLGETPTPGPTPAPTPTPAVVTRQELLSTISEFGFELKLDRQASVRSAGWTRPEPNHRQGSLTFRYGDVNTILIWGPREGRETLLLLADTYNILRGSQPELVFEPIIDGDISVSGEPGVYGGFRTLNANDTLVGGGLIGSWVCPERDTAFRLTLTGADSTVVQLRFNRHLVNFACSS